MTDSAERVLRAAVAWWRARTIDVTEVESHRLAHNELASAVGAYVADMRDAPAPDAPAHDTTEVLKDDL